MSVQTSKALKDFTYSDIVVILRKMPIEEKIKLENFLEKDIQKQRKLPKGFIPAQRKGSYASICGLWENMEISKDKFRETVWQRKSLF